MVVTWLVPRGIALFEWLQRCLVVNGWYHVVTALFGCYMAGSTWLQRCLVVTWLVPRGTRCLVDTWLVPRGTALFEWLQRCLVVTWLVPRGYRIVWLLHGWCRVVIALFGCYMAGTTWYTLFGCYMAGTTWYTLFGCYMAGTT